MSPSRRAHWLAAFALPALVMAGPQSTPPSRVLTAAASLDPSTGSASERGSKLLAAHRYREAFDLLEAAAETHPDDRRLAKKAYLAGLSHLLQLYKARKFDEIVALSDRVTTFDPEDYQSYFARGRALEELKRPAEALESYRKAREHSDRDFVARALANAYILSGDFPGAIEQFEHVVSSGRSRQRDLENLGVSYYKTGDTEKAISTLQKALEISPGNATLTALLARYTKEHGVQSRYSSSSNAHFDILFENTPAQRELKENLLRILELAYAEVTQDFGFRPEEIVQVVIYPSSGVYREASDAPTWSAAVYDGKIRIPAGETNLGDEALQRILQHEFTHLVVEKLGGRRVPAWMNEGIAQVEEKREVPWAKPLLRRVLGNKNLRGSFAALQGLERSFTTLAGDQARLAYAEAFFAVKYILDAGGMWTFTRMLGEIKDGSDPGEALRSATGYDYEQFQKRWVESLYDEFHLARP